MRRVALVTTAPGVLSGVTVFMETLRDGLRERGYDSQLLHPGAHSFGTVPGLGAILGNFMIREDLRGYDAVIGNGIGTIGAIDVDVAAIDTVHATAAGHEAAFTASYAALDAEGQALLDRVLTQVCGRRGDDVLASVAPNRLSLAADAAVARAADAVVAVSWSTRDEAVRYFGLEPGSVEVIPNGIGPRWSEPRQYHPSVAGAEVNVIHTARAGCSPLVAFWKGLDRYVGVMEGLQDIPALGIFHVGGAKNRAAFEGLLRNVPVPYVLDVPNGDLPSYLRAGDIYLHTSRYEACSLALMEAMASGLVPVAFPSGMAEVQIQDGVTGFIVRTVGEMRERVRSLAGQPALRARVGAAAARTMREEYGVDRMADRYASLLERVIGAR